MLRLVITIEEGYDETSEQFVAAETKVVELEHSLLSLSKWESEWEVPFLSTTDKTQEQTLSYVKAMSPREEVTDELLAHFSSADFDRINTYINKKMSATTINDSNAKKSREIVTNELIYHWMIALGIPKECEEWHLNRLLTLVKVCNIKNTPQKKMTSAQAGQQARELNAQRRAQLGTRG